MKFGDGRDGCAKLAAADRASLTKECTNEGRETESEDQTGRVLETTQTTGIQLRPTVT